MKIENNSSSIKRKTKNIGVILLVIILLLTITIGGVMLRIKYANKDNVIDKNNNESVSEDNDIINNGDNDGAEDVTEEDIEKFLSPLVSGTPNYNLLLSTNDNYDNEIIFSSIIQYLLANNIYTKSDNNYLFKQSDIKNVAKKYLVKDNFDYISTNNQFIYDSSSKIFSSTLQFGVYGFDVSVTKKLENYSVDGNKINVNYKVTIASIHPETGKISTGTTYSYAITLEKIDTELKIINIVNN